MNKERKIVFFDIDGTLLDHDKKMPDSTKKAIKDLKDKGVYVAIATGRAPFHFEDIREELGIDTYVSCNGGYVVLEGKVIYKSILPTEDLRAIENLAMKSQHPIIYLNHQDFKVNIEGHPAVEKCMADLKLSEPLYDPNFMSQNEIYHAILCCQKEEEAIYMNRSEDFVFLRWHEQALDIIPKGLSKAKGIEAILKALSYERKDSYAFGDGHNDMEMLEFVGTGIAMGNALAELKLKANFVTEQVSKDGILLGLKKVALL
ncbi:Cof-like hydrolase [Alkaliphilus metalliredigens QYMF]|uniref:Cof-like hydrolase n=1 Tax=Alkaliphilus metalliredigens (strain QYMF) TaxID=293826 RepID=A6TLP5_ALKMQ|nr:Cof-type HAD-IIB family hydrolase [Alkaliphilus metalliredigens]ABR47113.1 Cof-like hydrolase [Alkaliphilus metalliredigens QYMF]